MVQTGLPVAQKISMQEIFLFDAVDGDLSVSCITQLDLLVPLFLAAHFAFALERGLPP